MSLSEVPVSEPAPSGDQPCGSAAWRRYVPWQGPATGVDKALMATILAVVAVGLVLRPLKPFLLASHPVLLEFLTGDLTTIGAAAAFARIGEAPLWLVVLGGVVGMMKLDWLTWWAGRQWGRGIIRMFTTSERARRFALRAGELNPWIVRGAVLIAMLPGIPTALVYAMAGWAGMRLTTFLLLNLLGTLSITGLIAGLGYGLGQEAVNLVVLVDRYASVVSLTMIGLAAAIPLVKRRMREHAAQGKAPVRRRAVPRRGPQRHGPRQAAGRVRRSEVVQRGEDNHAVRVARGAAAPVAMVRVRRLHRSLRPAVHVAYKN